MDDYTFYFDVKTDNSDVTSSVMLFNSAQQRSTQVAFNNSHNNSFASANNGISKTVLSDGWVRITVRLNTTFSGYDKSETEELYIIFSNAYGDYTKGVTYYVDNMCFKNAQGSRTTPTPVEADYGDLGERDHISTSKLGAWMVATDLKLQKGVTSGSNSAIRGSFNLNTADEWYDSTNDPNGDGGKWVWSAFTLDLTDLTRGSTDWVGKKLSFDVKLENCSPTISLTYIDANGYRPTELPVNATTDANNVSSLSGFSKKVLSNGWVRITANLNDLFESNDISNIDKLIIIFSNATSDYVNDSVYYIDNISLKYTLS